MSDKSVCDEDLVSITFTAFNLLNFKKGMVHLHFYVDFFFQNDQKCNFSLSYRIAQFNRHLW